jgi:PAS domain S-box-containing protein
MAPSKPTGRPTFVKAEKPKRIRTADALWAAGLGEWDADLVTGQVALSRRVNHLFGFADQPLTIEDIRARYHPDDQQRVAAETAAALADPSKSVVRNSFRVVRADGSVAWVEARGRIFRDPSGRAIRTMGVMLDITDQKETELALEQTWRRFETALANTAVVVWQQDLSLRYTWINNARLGYKANAVIGHTDSELMGPELGRPVEAIKRRVIETGRSAHEEVVVQGEQGRATYDLYIEPLHDEHGVAVGITCAAIELSKGERRVVGSAQTLSRHILDREFLLDALGSRAEAELRGPGLVTSCARALQKKISAFASLTAEESSIVAQLEWKRRFLPAKQDFVVGKPGRAPRSWLLGSGWACSYTLLSDGERQIISFHIPGDMTGLSRSLFASSDHSYSAITDCVICEIDNRLLRKILQSETNLSSGLLQLASCDEAIIEQHLINVGRRSALARVAHLLLELGTRLQLVGLADEGGYRCPLNQDMLADALGMTNVHVNRMLRKLRELGYAVFRNGYVSFTNKTRLIELADYDPSYLSLRNQVSQPFAGTGN